MLLNRTRSRKHINSEGSWAISYVDLLTLLLCLFIIFYSAEKFKGKNPQTQSSIIKLASKFTGSEKAVQGETPKPANAAKQAEFLDSIESAMANRFKIESVKKDGLLEVNFKDISFFRSGSVSLNPEARGEIEEMIRALEPYKDSIHIIVQGHTDAQPVTAKRNQFSDNWELSVIRATSVLKLFLMKGYSQDSLSAEGFADSRTVGRDPADAETHTEEELSRMRRITLRIEPKRAPSSRGLKPGPGGGP
jgi:chemotaxis protein MotB